jgi:hypothetical protein
MVANTSPHSTARMSKAQRRKVGVIMRISRVRVQGFRCLKDLDVAFDDVTTLIGPNGVGKSSFLRALDWFFNGTPSSGPSLEDLHPAAMDGRIRVEVEFVDLTGADRVELGSYAPTGVERVLLWRTWTNDTDVFSGNARAYEPFGEIRTTSGAMAKRTLYSALREARPELELPVTTSATQVDSALQAWESQNPDQLTDAEIPTTTRFFGFLGDAKLKGLFDFVFVSADLRAAEETEDSRNATIGRLLERTIDRSQITTELDGLVDGLNVKQAGLVAEHLTGQLDELAVDLTAVVNQFTIGREVKLDVSPAEVKVSPLQFVTHILDGTVQTTVSGQGHGFQRALLIAALKMVAERGRQDPDSGTILLAIEEPELYQHPSQARSFGRNLRRLAEEPDQALQVVYATHSPWFIEPGAFHQIRRLRRVIHDGEPRTVVTAASHQRVIDTLAGIVSEATVRKQIDKACPQQLAEAVFADSIILVEGETDKALFDAVAVRDGGFATRNAAIVDVSGKDSLPLCRAILDSLDIPTLLVADNDLDHRLDAGDEQTDNARQAESRARRSNRRLLRAIGNAEEDWPEEGLIAEELAFLSPNLEAYLSRAWPEWEQARDRLIAEEVGYGGKHGLTYANAVREAESEPPELLRAIISAALAKLGGSNM